MQASVNNLHNWLFHFNVYTDQWECCQRDYITELWSNRDSPFILRSNSINVLQEIIIKFNGNVPKDRLL